MLLAIDTSQANLMKIWLYGKDGLVKEKSQPTKRGQLEELLLAIDELLREEKLALTDLEKIAVNCGPGAYTGLRIGITTANTLAKSLDIPIFGFQETLKDQKLKEIQNTNISGFNTPVLPVYRDQL